jgi:hypothetical protein
MSEKQILNETKKYTEKKNNLTNEIKRVDQKILDL